MGLPVMSYETWEKGREAIDTGGSVLDAFVGTLAFEAPPVALILEIASKLLGWAIAKIWDALPHEHKTDRLKSFPLASLHAPGQTFPVQDPRWAEPVTNQDTVELEKTIDAARRSGEYGKIADSILIPDVPVVPSMPVAHPSDIVHIGVRLFSPGQVLREEYTTRNQVRKKGTGINPTFGRAGF